METCGYAGKILHVDLGFGGIKAEKLDMDIARDYLGGQGINTRLIYNMLKPGVDPLSPGNIILLGAGALGGTPAVGASKITATTKFPLNGAIGTAAGCGFAPMLKWSGYDNVVITGASPKPVYLLIYDDDARLLDGQDLWGKDIFQTTDILRARHGRDISVICIGQAGENLVRISLAFIDKIAHLGRGGLGAVFGSKKLKGVVVRGTRGVKIAHKEMFQRMQDFLVSHAEGDRNRKLWINYGLQGVAERWFKNGLVLVNNKREAPDAAEMIASYGMRAFDEMLAIRPWAGPSCVTCDKSIIRLKKGRFKGLTTTASVPSAPSLMGPLFQLTLDEAVKCHDLFQRYGVDELDGEYLIEFIVDLYHKGLITSKELGMEPKLDFATVTYALERIVRREGFWATVADGIPTVLKSVKDAKRYAIHSKGMVPNFDGRMCLGVEAFGDSMTNPRGGQAHSLVRSPSTAVPGLPQSAIQAIAAAYQVPLEARNRIFKEKEPNIARLTPYVQNTNTGYNCLGVCYRFFIGRLWNPAIAAGVYHAVTGIPLTPEEFMLAGERSWNLQKVLNLREGFGREHDCFPKRWVKEPVKFGDEDVYLQDYTKTRRLSLADTEKMLDDYYDERGWGLKNGGPTEDKLLSLKLEGVIQELENAGKL